MTLRFVDGFDWTADGNDRRRKYNGNSGTNVIQRAGRYGAYAGSDNAGSYLYLDLDAQNTWIIGIAIYKNQSGDGDIVQIIDDTTVQVTFARVSDTVKAYRGTTGGTLLGSTGIIWQQGEWTYVEMKVVIHDTTGTIDIVVEGVSELSLTSQDTQITGNATANNLAFGNCGVNAYRDDLYVCDGAGSTNNNFLGDVRVETTYPNGNGTTSDFVGSDANSVDNYLLVDEVNPDDNTTYVESATLNAIDLYAVGDLSNSPNTIFGIANNIMCKKTDVSLRSITEKVRSGGTNYAGTVEMPLTSNYRVLQQVRETDPATAVAWTTGGVNALEVGFEITT